MFYEWWDKNKHLYLPNITKDKAFEIWMAAKEAEQNRIFKEFHLTKKINNGTA